MPASDTRAASPASPKTARGQKTREALLRASEKVFGGKGYYAASISEITQEADVAMGTFYLYFKDKEDVFRALVQHMLELLRAHLRKHVAPATTQMEAERLGLKAFLSFVSRHKNLYRIVLDSYSVDETIYSGYFQVFAELYSRRLAKAEEQGEILPGDAEVRAWCLIGISNFLGMRYALWKRPASMDKVVDSAFDLIEHGLAVR
ncbi:TetR family transcriptional regulator [Cupriavidus sp. USMAA2-4]|uniref:TetR family transcriptional regulator n=1 Tax=Cupriavidus malaysiensis TaxID=367825 RepID=A0ABN4TI11_9BURK|nr:MULTISPECIES: TetR/AcrR family transcriptional regulator [Cupriavidus]AOY93612.1 TetR family transcriptional regulator [Cupriavidus sp. USMAA2-4]AOZ00110.1 TetR family transcriptional regulator [Cupriavidus sp. USMAHM13]AOZ06854.1 TetR family transcriptional regulator [Cupriavidus malaysiensis]